MAEKQERYLDENLSDEERDSGRLRQPTDTDQRTGSARDTRTDAKGSARDNVGNTARGTAADPTGPEGNDNTRHPNRPDEFGDGDRRS